MKKYITIEGMKCQGCENRVKEALESLYFVRLAVVDHEARSAIVKMPVEVPDAILKECIEELGYKVKSIERLLCGCKNIREIDVKNLIESGVDTSEAILEQTGLGSFGCCSKDIVPLLIDKYKNGKDIDIQSEVFKGSMDCLFAQIIMIFVSRNWKNLIFLLVLLCQVQRQEMTVLRKKLWKMQSLNS